MELTAAYRRLVEVVRLVASPPEVQLAALPEWTCRGDEIALLFHEEMLTVRLLVESGAVSSQGLAVLKEIDRRFDEMSGELNAELWTDSAVRTRPEWYTQVGSTSNYFRTKVEDGYGNHIDYGRTDQNGIAYLDSITDTRGVRLLFTWDTNTPKRVTKIAIDTSTVQLVPSVSGSDLEIGFAYTNDGARKLRSIQWFTTTVVHDQDGDGAIETGENLAGVRPSVELVYEMHGLLGEIWNSTVTPWTRQLQTVYALHTGNGIRVIEQREGGTGTVSIALHTYGYPGQYSRTYTDPVGTVVGMGLDGSYRVNNIVMTASSAGKPRAGEPVHLQDHNSLQWTLPYACCGLPQTITENSGRDWTFDWDGDFLESVQLNNGPLLHLFTGSNGRVTSWTVGGASTPRLTFAYNGYTPLSGAYASVDIATPGYTDAHGSSESPVSATLTFDAQGHLVQTNRTGLGTSSFAYLTSGKGRGLLHTISGPAAGSNLVLTYECDDLGRLASVKRGQATGVRTTSIVADTFSRPTSISAPATSGGPALTREIYYDHFGDVSWTRSDNRDDAGVARTRPWIQAVRVRDEIGRLVKIYRDSALVDAAQESLILTTYAWDSGHRLSTMVSPTGATTQYVFDGYGFLYKSIIDQGTGGENLVPARYFYDIDGHVIEARNAFDDTLVLDRYPTSSNHAGLLQRARDPAHLNDVVVTYDSALRVSRVTLFDWAGAAERRVTDLQYDEIGQLKRVEVRPASGQTLSARIHIYDAGSRLVEVGLQENSADTSFLRGFKRGFDAYGRLTFQRDRLSDTANLWNQVSFEYDSNSGLPTKMIEQEIEQAAGEFGLLSSGGSHATRTYETWLQHDLLDRVVQVEQKPEGVPSQGPSVLHKYGFDSLGSLVRFEDTLHAQLKWVYDGLGLERKRTEVGVSGGQITTTRDINYAARLVTRTDAEQRVSKFYYDGVGRLTKQELPGYFSGSAFSHDFGYDAAGRLTDIVNGNGVLIKREYDKSGRLESHWATANTAHTLTATKETFTYDVFGHVKLAETFAGSPPNYTSVVRVEFNHDAYDRNLVEGFHFFGQNPINVDSGYSDGGAQDFLVRRSLTSAGTPSVALKVDRTGRVWGYGAGSGAAEEWIARYRFVGRRVQERQQGKQPSANDWLLSTTNGWDNLRRLTSIDTKTVAGATQLSLFEHEYDIEGHLKKRKRTRIGTGGTPGAGDWFKLDEYYRLAGVKLGVDASQFGNQYASDSDYNGITSYQRAIEYSPASAPLDKAQNRHLVRETVGGVTTDTPYVVNSSSHRYDEVNSVPLVYDDEGNTLFDGLYHYRYDFKNRLSEVYVYVPADGEQAISGSATRSADGKPRYLVPRSRLERIYARGRDRLASLATDPHGLRTLTRQGALLDQSSITSSEDGNLQIVAVYRYDPYNRRVVRQLTGQDPLFSTWDGWREVAEYLFTGSAPWWLPLRNYVWGSRLDEMIRFSKSSVVNGQIVWTHYYPQQDHQDSVDLLVDKDGVPQEKYEYAPFGLVRTLYMQGGSWLPTPDGWSSVGNPYLYAGRRVDPETGLAYYRNRYRSLALGRFLTMDPVGLWVDSYSWGNPYAYAGNIPTFLSDPMGLQVGHHVVPVALWAAPSEGPPRFDFSPEAQEVFNRSTTGAPAGGLPGDVHRWDVDHRKYNDAVADMIERSGKPPNAWTAKDAERFVGRVINSKNPDIARFLGKIESFLALAAGRGIPVLNRGIDCWLPGAFGRGLGRAVGELGKPFKCIAWIFGIAQFSEDLPAYGVGWATANAVNPIPFTNPTDWFGVPDGRPPTVFYPSDFIGPLPPNGVHY